MKLIIFFTLVALTISACVSAEARPAAEPESIDPAEASPNAIHVDATDYKFALSSASARAGSIDFVVTNNASQQHEFVIVPVRGGRYDLPLGEIEPFDSGRTEAMRAQLPPGRYQLVCLIVSIIDGEPRSHMARGMSVDFEVTD